MLLSIVVVLTAKAANDTYEYAYVLAEISWCVKEIADGPSLIVASPLAEALHFNGEGRPPRRPHRVT